jgi:hypothetical protein
MPKMMRGMLGALAFSPSMLHNTPLTVSGTEPTCQQRQSARHGRAARKASHQAHDFEKSVWPLFLW